MALDFVAGCIGGGAGVIVGHPLDTVKVRLQLQDSRNPIYKGTMDAIYKISKKEGIRGFYSGVASPLMGMGLINAIVFGVYGNMMKAMKRNKGVEVTPDEHLRRVGIAGAMSGLAQVVVCSPMELAKIRLQADRTTQLNTVTWLMRVWKKDGLIGMYKGLTATTLREVPSFYIYFYVYEYLMRSSSGHIVTLMLNGGLAGCASWLFVYPADVIKTRIQMDGAYGHRQRYRGILHCLMLSVREEGAGVLMRGAVATMLRAFPVNAVTFLVVSLILRKESSA